MTTFPSFFTNEISLSLPRLFSSSVLLLYWHNEYPVPPLQLSVVLFEKVGTLRVFEQGE